MINAIIVDDEDLGRTMLFNMISKYCPNVNVIGQAASANEGIELINKMSPDLVFLDIEMPGGSGFDLLEKITDSVFAIIFTTAYNEYAVKAFKLMRSIIYLNPLTWES